MGHEITDASTLLLLADLEKLPQSFDRDELIRAAKRNRFHDFKSDSATPCVDLYKRLNRAGFTEMADAARNGKYDATKAESDEYAKTPEYQELFNQLQGKKK